jgi:hypothetical protein
MHISGSYSSTQESYDFERSLDRFHVPESRSREELRNIRPIEFELHGVYIAVAVAATPEASIGSFSCDFSVVGD